MLLRLAGVEVRRSGAPVLSDVGLTVERGTVVALVGGNGTGKTALLDGLLGLPGVALRGSVVLDEVELSGRATRERVRAGIGYAPQGRRLFPELTVRENLDLGAYRLRSARRAAEARARVLAWLPELTGRDRQPAGTLSGGEQQMLTIGRAFMAEPSLLLLDEPFLGLAAPVVERLGRVLREVADRGAAVVVAEPPGGAAARSADAVWRVDGSRVLPDRAAGPAGGASPARRPDAAPEPSREEGA